VGGVSGGRWFIALAPRTPQRLLDRLGPAPPLRLRALLAEDLHLTLVFLGDCSPAAAEAAFAGVRADPPPACRLAVTGARRLGAGRAAAWTLLLAQDPALRHWVEEHRDALLDGAGRPRETRDFLPHLTLARGEAPTADAAGAVQTWLAQAQGFELEFHRLGLYCAARLGARRYAMHRESILAA
jgi:2'-5' RNA ligase